MKEVLISFAVFVFCISVTIYSQLNSPKIVNAAQSEIISNTNASLTKSTTVKKVNLFELDPSDPNPTLLAMADNSKESENLILTPHLLPSLK